MKNYVPQLKNERKKERFWTWNMNKFSLLHDDKQTFREFDLPLGLFFMTGSGSGHCSSLMFNKEAKSFNQTSMFPGKLAFVTANADSRSSFFICK